MVTCLECGKQIKTIDEPIKVKGGYNCQACYYEALGNIIERSPIQSYSNSKGKKL